ncbi:hypothetical protein [Mycobacterium servetii]|uniref:Uncharacterized protein n=1 Tax=Mycobacterium servetii TaxID=3237418 RepID=A0ABV4BXL2_9MYCO
MTATWARWLERYGDDYPTLAERIDAYESYLHTRDEMERVFGGRTEDAK